MIRHPALATLLTVGLLSSTAAFGEEFGNIIINNSAGDLGMGGFSEGPQP